VRDQSGSVPLDVARALSADLLPTAIIVVDVEDRILDGNGRFAEWIGVPVSDAIGRPLDSYLRVGRRAGLARLGGRAVLVARTDTPDGAVIALMDADERAAFETRLVSTRTLEERTRDRLQLVIDASIAFAAAPSELALAEILATTAAEAYRAEEAVVFIDDGAGAYPRIAGVFPFAEHLAADFVDRVLGSGNVVKVTNAKDAVGIGDDLAAAMRERGVHALIAAPLRHDDELLGIFACFFHHPRGFDAEAAPLADALAVQAAQVATTLRLQRRLQYAANHDEITGLPNRRYLDEERARYETPRRGRVAAIFIDLDGFKRVNDQLGHHTGDHLLGEIGRRLRGALREDDLVARYGGDEFVVLCDVSDASAARDLAERLRRNLAIPFDFLPPTLPIGASFGVAVASGADYVIEIDPLIRAADQAMYRSKAAGGNRIVVDQEPDAHPGPLPDTGAILTPGQVAAALRGAVARGELSAWFQPQIDLATGAVVAAEALCRWHHPQLGQVGPATFIPVAEDAGLIDEIGRFMADQACLALDAWSSAADPLDIAVNVSPLQLKSSGFVDWLAERLARRERDDGRLTLEITESRPIMDLEAVVDRLERLRGLGVGVAIDDFGAGHATLDQLDRLHGTEIKIDRSLVSDSSWQAEAQILDAIVVARRSGIQVVAEGIETSEQLERVRALGCDRAQGYLIGHPVPWDEFAALREVNPSVGG
jgi:diguanylate cyclase (GGDEF)-like protein